MISFRDRTFCNAYCTTAKCSRRWTKDLQDAADRWWNPKGNPNLEDGAPVAFSNFAPDCPDYANPVPGEPQHQLGPGETNP